MRTKLETKIMDGGSSPAIDANTVRSNRNDPDRAIAVAVANAVRNVVEELVLSALRLRDSNRGQEVAR